MTLPGSFRRINGIILGSNQEAFLHHIRSYYYVYILISYRTIAHKSQNSSNTFKTLTSQDLWYFSSADVLKIGELE